MPGYGLFQKLLTVILIVAPSAVGSQESLEDRYSTALGFLGTEEYERAIQAFQQIVSERPDFHRAYVSLSDAFFYNGDRQGARGYFQGLLDENSDNAYAHYGLAQVELGEQAFHLALEHLKRAIALQPDFSFAYGHDGGIADVYRGMNDLHGAIAFFRALVDERPSNASAHYGLGCTYRDLYDWDNALKFLDEAIRLDPELTLAYREKIAVYGLSARYRNVLENSDELLALAVKRDEPAMVGYARFAQSTALFYLGDYWKALDYSNEALGIFEEIGDKDLRGTALNNLGNIYGLVGDRRRARELYMASRDLARASGDTAREINALINIGNSYFETKDLKAASAYLHEALELAIDLGSRLDESYALINLGAVYSEAEDLERAFDALGDALSIARDVGDRSLTGSILADLGGLHRERGELEAAAELLHEALAIGTEIEDVEVIWRSRAKLGLVLEEQGDLEGALAQFAQTISLYDAALDSLGLESMSTHFLDAQDLAFPAMIRLLAQGGRYDEAFRYAEKFKAARLLALLSQSRSVAEELLPESVRSNLERLSTAQEAVHAELSLEQAKEGSDRETLLALERKLTDVELQRKAAIDQLKREHPSYYRLTTADLADIEDLRSRALGAHQTLLEYIVGREQLSIFVLTRDELAYESVAISKEDLKRMLAELSPAFTTERPSDDGSLQRIFNAGLASFSIPPARALYDVLIQPVEPRLTEGTELIIVPDDVLSYLPFEILVVDAPSETGRYDFADATFLLERYPVSYAVSLSLLDPELQKPREASRGVLALGNPDFSRREEDRLSAEYVSNVVPYAGGVFRGGDLLPLPSAEAEVSAIRRAISGSRVYVGPRATETIFKKEAAEYRVLHLATHFLSDDRQPLYSKVVLAKEEDSDEDGYLETYEIFNSRLNADLAVLSACNTGLGRLSRGEGLVGISRAFLYAGVPSLVVSLWSVDDEASSVLMQNFYGHLRRGWNKTEALRRAKLDYLRSAPDAKKDPFYWAPFILIGDASPLALPDGPSRTIVPVILGAALLAATLSWLAIRRRRDEAL